MRSIIFLILSFSAFVRYGDAQNKTQGNEYPGTLYREHFHERMLSFSVANLTSIFIKDAMYKLRLADYIRSGYKRTIGFELGMISASIMETFKHMIKLYRVYANQSMIADFFTGEWTETYMQGYQIMQSDFYEIRKLREMFDEVVRQHEEENQNTDPRLQEYIDKYPGIDPKIIADALKNGMLGNDRRRRGSRRSFKPDLSPDTTDPELEQFLASLKNSWTVEDKKETGNSKDWSKRKPNKKDVEAYKKLMRYKTWVQNWKGFDPAVEGVDIQDHVADIAFHNASNFLAKEFKGIL